MPPHLSTDPTSIGAALSTYKPSTLLVEIPDSNNIDNKLGVKNLVTTAATPSASGFASRLAPNPPIAKSRANNSNQCAADSGSVIYAQSAVLKNGFNSSSSNGETLRFNKDKTSGKPVQYSNVRGNSDDKSDKTNPGISMTTNNELNKWSNGTCTTSDLLF